MSLTVEFNIDNSSIAVQGTDQNMIIISTDNGYIKIRRSQVQDLQKALHMFNDLTKDNGEIK